MALLGGPWRWSGPLLCSLICDAGNALSLGLVLSSLDLHLPIGAWFVLVSAARLAGLVPSTPGQFGVVEAAMVLAMSAFGLPAERAFAAALIYHLAHFAPVTLLGLVELRRQLRS